MSTLDALTAWLFDGAPVPRAALAADPAAFAEAVRLLDDLASGAGAAEAADDLADVLEGILATLPAAARRVWVEALLPAAGPRGAAVLAPWVAGEAAQTPLDQVCAWLFEGAPLPAVAPEVLQAVRAELAQLAAAFLGDEGARLRFAAEILDPLDAQLEDLVPRPEPVPLAHDPLPSPALERLDPPQPTRRRAWVPVALVAVAAAVLLAIGLRPETPPERPIGPVGGGPETLVVAPPAVRPPAWPDAGRPPPSVLAETAVRPALLPVPAGTFLMGSPPGEAGRSPDEVRHQVTLTRDYYLARTEMTQAQWVGLMGTNPSKFKGNTTDLPVENITWYEALAALNALSAQEGLPACYTLVGCTGTPGGAEPYTCARADFVGPTCTGYRLPSEAEWEYAARAVTSGATWAGELVLRDVRNAPVLDAIAWYSGNSGVDGFGLQCPEPEKMQHPAGRCGTHPVAGKLPNPLGFYDMLGNVWEWTGDAWGVAEEAPVVDPTGGADTERRVTKGCGWFRDARFCRAANRYRPRAGFRSSVIGLRPARTIPPGFRPGSPAPP